MIAHNAGTRERENAETPPTGGDGALLLALAAAAGLTVLAEGDTLVVRGPKSAQPVAEAVIARKAAVLAELYAGAAPTSRVSGFSRLRVPLVADDGFVHCADCDRPHYGVAGFPALCPGCLRERAGLPPNWWDSCPPAPRRRRDLRPAGRCYACRTVNWRERPTGGRVCATCHAAAPRPARTAGSLVATPPVSHEHEGA